MSDEATFTCGTCRASEPVEYETRFRGEPICRECWKAHQVRSLTATRDLLHATRDLIRPAVCDSMPVDESREQAEVRAREALAELAEVCSYQLYRLQGRDWATERIREEMAKAKGADAEAKVETRAQPVDSVEHQGFYENEGIVRFRRDTTEQDGVVLFSIPGVKKVASRCGRFIAIEKEPYREWEGLGFAIKQTFRHFEACKENAPAPAENGKAEPEAQVADAASAVRVEQCNAYMFGYAHLGRPVTADDCRTLLKVDGVDYVVEIGDDRIQFRSDRYEPWPKVTLAIERAFAKKPNVRHDADKEKARRILRSVVADRGDHRPIDWALAVLLLGMLKEEESK